MILVDTNVLVALVDPRDRLHRRAAADLQKLVRRSFLVTCAVLTEACFALPQPHLRARLSALVATLAMRPVPGPTEAAMWQEAFDWLARYADHDPDWCDALTVVLSGRERRLRVWTYDREFSTVWRRLDGSRIPLAVVPARA